MKEERKIGRELYHYETVAYGFGKMDLRIPLDNYSGTLRPIDHLGLQNETAEVGWALKHPIGSPSLEAIIERKKPQQTVIVVNDGTRPTATSKLLSPLLNELHGCGIENDKIRILIATGSHPDVPLEEFEGLLGKGIGEKYQIVNHHCQDMENMVDLGITSQGIPIVLNRLFCEADLKILTGSIHPHQRAGFSGGRKSVLPGIASLETLRLHHSDKFCSQDPAMGWIEGNPFHHAAMEAAKKVGTDFILNAVQNKYKQILKAFAGNVEAAWLAGVKASRELFEIDVPSDIDIVVASPGGYPRDKSLYQSQKAMAVAETIVKKRGSIILPAACPDGVGSEGFYEWMTSASCPEEVIKRFQKEGYSIGTSKAWLYSRCLTKAELIVVSDGLDEDTLLGMFTKKAPDLETALEMSLNRQGNDAKILVIQNAADIIPKKR